MKNLFLLPFLFPIFIYAQCDHNPIISNNGMPVTETLFICPPEDNTTTLTTQMGTSYQWKFKYCFPDDAPWQNGPTTQDFTIDYFNYSCTYIKVVVTTNGCTEESPEIFVDGYAFSLPNMLISFSDNNFEQIDNNEFNVCNGTDVTLEATTPYLSNIQWYNNSNVINNATNQTFTVTSNGTYIYTSCTAICPNFCQPDDVPGPFPTTFNFGNWSFCSLNVENPDKQNQLTIYPNPTTQLLYIGKTEDVMYSEIQIIDTSGKTVLRVENLNVGTPINVSSISSGNYIILFKSIEGKLYKNKFIKK